MIHVAAWWPPLVLCSPTCEIFVRFLCEFEVDLALGEGPVVADGDAGSSGHHLEQGGLADTFGFSGLDWSGSRRSPGPGRSPSSTLSPREIFFIFFLTADGPVAVLTLSWGATTAASKRVWEAGTLDFTTPVIVAISVEVEINFPVRCK